MEKVTLEKLLELHSQYVFRVNMLPEAAEEIEKEWKKALESYNSNDKKDLGYDAAIHGVSINALNFNAKLPVALGHVIADRKKRFERNDQIRTSQIKSIQWDAKGIILVTNNSRYWVVDASIEINLEVGVA